MTERRAGSKQEGNQPYATETEAYRFETVKSPVHPDARKAHGGEKSDIDSVAPVKGDGRKPADPKSGKRPAGSKDTGTRPSKLNASNDE